MRLVNIKTYPLNLQQLVFGHLGTEVEPNTGKLSPFSVIKWKELPILVIGKVLMSILCLFRLTMLPFKWG